MSETKINLSKYQQPEEMNGNVNQLMMASLRHYAV